MAIVFEGEFYQGGGAVMACDCDQCMAGNAWKNKTVDIQKLGVSMARFALSRDPVYSVSPPLTKAGKLKVAKHQECGNDLVPASNGRMACCYCLKTGYLVPAPDTSVGSN